VEGQTVVEALGRLLPRLRVGPLPLALGQLGEVADRLRRVILEELESDGPLRRVKGGE
jgi:hypothetical protein